MEARPMNWNYYDILLSQAAHTNHITSSASGSGRRHCLSSPTNLLQSNSSGSGSPSSGGGGGYSASSISPSSTTSSSSGSSSHGLPLSDDLSALQKLQFALEKNMLFNDVSGGNHVRLRVPGSIPDTATPYFEGTAIAQGGGGNGSGSCSPGSKRRKKGMGTTVVKAQLKVPTAQAPAATTPMTGTGAGPKSGSGQRLSPEGAAAVVSLEPVIPENVFECPLCSIVCNDRHSFNEHLTTHTQQNACPKCSFITNTKDSLDLHLRQVHSIIVDDEGVVGAGVGVDDDDDEDGIPVPKGNVGNKLKSFKCKSCPHVSTTKKEYWSHSKVHIKQEKLLQCPKCPFVTEYKHHLEYHLRNHTNSKPFQCNHCQYSCVNKSMLASHLKSHSTIYQYRCKDCDYCTKYCHSLKIHLRKYGHEPSAVLNLDGTVNSFTIIDVYGTRRGPKVKNRPVGVPAETLCVRPKKVKKTQGTQVPQVVKEKKRGGGGDVVKGAAAPAHVVKQLHLQLRSRGETGAREHVVTTQGNGKGTITVPNLKIPTPSSNMLQQLLLKQQLQCQEKQQQYRKNTNRASFDVAAAKPAATFSPPPPNGGVAPLAAAGLNLPPNLLEFYTSAVVRQYLNPAALLLLQQQQQQQQQHPNQYQHHQNGGTAVFSPPQTPQNRNPNQEPVNGALDLTRRSSPMAPTNGKRSRKGQALKYVKYEEEEEDESEEDDEPGAHLMEEDDGCHGDDVALDFSNNNNENEVNKEARARAASAKSASKVVDRDLLRCVYCEISFPDSFLYSLHMNFHSVNSGNPFQCKCGVETKDKVSFYIHLTEESH